MHRSYSIWWSGHTDADADIPVSSLPGHNIPIDPVLLGLGANSEGAPVHDPAFRTVLYDPCPSPAPLPSGVHDPTFLAPTAWNMVETWPVWFCNLHRCLNKLEIRHPQSSQFKKLLAIATQFEAKHSFAQPKADVLRQLSSSE